MRLGGWSFVSVFATMTSGRAEPRRIVPPPPFARVCETVILDLKKKKILTGTSRCHRSPKKSNVTVEESREVMWFGVDTLVSQVLRIPRISGKHARQSTTRLQ